jgi:hypothetical protein
MVSRVVTTEGGGWRAICRASGDSLIDLFGRPVPDPISGRLVLWGLYRFFPVELPASKFR